MKFWKYFFIVPFLLSSCDNKKESHPNAVNNLSLQNTEIANYNQQIKSNPNNPELYHQRAKYYLENKNAKAAMSDIERALMLDSTQVEFYLLLANIYFITGKTGESKKALEKCITINPQQIEALLKLAELYLYVNQYQKSIDYVNDALKVDIYNAKAYFIKGMNYKYIGDTAKAISSMQTAVEQNPDYYEPYIQLGLLFAAKHNPLSIDYYNNALKISPKNIEAYYNKSLFLQEHGEMEKAIQGYQTILQINPDYYQAHYNMGYVHLIYLKEYQKAVKHFTDAIHLKSDYFEAYYNRGLCYEKMGNKMKAEENYYKSLAIRPNYTLAAKGISRVVDDAYE